MVLLPMAPFVLASPAHADGPGRCYPPPCAVELPQKAAVAQTATLGGGSVVVAGSAEAAGSNGSPVPDVVVGLTAVVGSLTAVGLRRRRNIDRRVNPRAEPSRRRPAAVRNGRERENEQVAVS